ncbi:MAG: hypothetical protein LQ347_003959 [Umbilicaria vellea]|nr:MAG: hypothetical protein LQ347_003959 [Umbilicaria vellea]
MPASDISADDDTEALPPVRDDGAGPSNGPTGLLDSDAASGEPDLVIGCRVIEKKEPRSRRKHSVTPKSSTANVMCACGLPADRVEPLHGRQSYNDIMSTSMSVPKSTAVRPLSTPSPVAGNIIGWTSYSIISRQSILRRRNSLVPSIYVKLGHTQLI